MLLVVLLLVVICRTASSGHEQSCDVYTSCCIWWCLCCCWRCRMMRLMLWRQPNVSDCPLQSRTSRTNPSLMALVTMVWWCIVRMALIRVIRVHVPYKYKAAHNMVNDPGCVAVGGEQVVDLLCQIWSPCVTWYEYMRGIHSKLVGCAENRITWFHVLYAIFDRSGKFWFESIHRCIDKHTPTSATLSPLCFPGWLCCCGYWC